MSFAVKVLLCAVAGGLLSNGEAAYSRTVSYKHEVLIKCSRVDADVMKLLDGADIWRVDVQGAVTFRIAKSGYRRLKDKLRECAELGNVEDIVKKSEHEMLSARVRRSVNWFDKYHDLGEITNWWEELAWNNEEVTCFNIGESYEGRDVFAVNITAVNNTNSSDPDVPVFYFQCLIHAREWISGASCMYVVNEIMEEYTQGNERVKAILENAMLLFVPVVNPDGYAYTWTTDRLWHKNRRPIPGSTCTGVDLNRNFNDHWGQGGSNDPCAETYRGANAVSEDETNNVENLFLSLPKVYGAMDWHSFSQLILRPWGWTTADTPDEDRLKTISEKMAKEIKMVHNKIYKPIKIIQHYTLAGGNSIDWFYSDAGNINNEVRAAGLAFELRDTGDTEFLLPPDQIIPNGEEIYPAVLHFIETLLDTPLQKF